MKLKVIFWSAAAVLGAVAVLAAGCGEVSANNNNTVTEQDGTVWQDAGPPIQDAAPPVDVVPVLHDKVYAHSSSTLFEVNPNDLSVTTVGTFGWPASIGSDQMTDIALDEEGDMIGISFDYVYAVDKATAACTYLSDLDSGFFGYNGLSWVEGVGIDPNVKTLVGVNLNGAYVKIDPDTGEPTNLGTYGGGFVSSGDLVFIRGAGVYATASSLSYGTDVLVSVNAGTGQATFIGETGFNDIWGLAYWGGQLFGFTDAGDFLLIDPDTGQGSLVESTSYRFWGAGVTTTAPIVR